MGLFDQIGGILKQYETPGATANNVSAHFNQIASALGQPSLADGIAHALRSGQSPDFAQTVSQLFGQANPAQKAGILSQLLSSTPAHPLAGATPEQAQQVSPDMVKQLAAQIHGVDPAVIDRLSGFCSQHPTLFNGVGASVLGVIMSRISQQHR